MLDRMVLGEKDFVSPPSRKFYLLMSEVCKDGLITDVEIPENEYVRAGTLKHLRIFKTGAGNKVKRPIKFERKEIEKILEDITPRRLKDENGRIKELPLCFSFSIEGKGHFRVTVFMTRIGVCVTLRRLAYVVPDWDKLGIPRFVVDEFLKAAGITKRIGGEKGKEVFLSGTYRGGLILITGAMGCGKSTTMASMLKLILDNSMVKVLTIEDPVEYVLTSSLGFVSQLEVGTHCSSTEEALKYGLRSNASVIALGEVRTREEIKFLLEASEVGCFTMATFHVPDTVAALERICYSLGSEIAVKTLASVLIGVLNQRLLMIERDGKKEFYLLVEWLPVRDVLPIRDFLLRGQFYEIRNGLEKRLWLEKYNAKSMKVYLREMVQERKLPDSVYKEVVKSFGIAEDIKL